MERPLLRVDISSLRYRPAVRVRIASATIYARNFGAGLQHKFRFKFSSCLPMCTSRPFASRVPKVFHSCLISHQRPFSLSRTIQFVCTRSVTFCAAPDIAFSPRRPWPRRKKNGRWRMKTLMSSCPITDSKMIAASISLPGSNRRFPPFKSSFVAAKIWTSNFLTPFSCRSRSPCARC